MAASHLRPSHRRAPCAISWHSPTAKRLALCGPRAGRAGDRPSVRAPSTISRELRRNAATRSGGFEYRATTAQWHADRAARRPKPAKLAVNARCGGTCRSGWPAGHRAKRRMVPGPSCRGRGAGTGGGSIAVGSRAWSPEQIARRLPRDFPDDDSMRISHEAIYQALYVQGRGALRRELTACLRTGRALRVPRARTRARESPLSRPSS